MKISIIILSFNTAKLTLQCLTSIRDQDMNLDDLEVIVSDNNSSDDTVEKIQEKFPWVTIIKNKKNLGFAAGNNRAIKKAKGDYLLLLNSDTIIAKDTLEKLYSFMEENPQAGASTARLELPDGSLDLACHRGFPTPWNAISYFLKLEQLFPETKIFSGYHQTYKNFNLPHEVDAISGACFFIKREVIDQVGLLDEIFFMYAEDIDWCMRIKQAGYKIFFIPEVKVIHFKKSSGRNKIIGDDDSLDDLLIRRDSENHFYETMKLFYEKHYKNKYPKFIRNFVIFGIWLKSKLIKK